VEEVTVILLVSTDTESQISVSSAELACWTSWVVSGYFPLQT